MRPEGFELVLHRSLTEPILMGGAPRAAAILIGTLSAVLALGLRLWLVGLALWIIGHGAAVWLAKRDPAFVEVAVRHTKHKAGSHAELERISRRRISARRLVALGLLGRTRDNPEQGWQLSADHPLSRSRPR
jgi:type IV secretion system protein TrbD